MHKLLAATALALTLSATGLACGDDDGEDTVDATVEDDAEGADITVPGDAAGTGEEFTGEGSEEFCQFAAEVEDVPDDDLEGLGEVYDEAIERAPEEIRGDFEVLRDAFRGYVETLDELGIEDGDLSAVSDPEQIQRLTELFADPEVTEATERVGAYITEVCGIE